ncbi:biogenesis of lysosome-related organelles complex 1 subunit 4-like [Ctenocephalides felis]|uniref:biogenesis of lysosome-related organelles complex 1 subunit 4-like n=1 Tax=Ctenocephalides felis TaxID=7515 RepID=UPI000E6E36BB|nr:biogenesis of lysosome-related organelles complex 1 subunit 4-like [Ctenocephalides felis]
MLEELADDYSAYFKIDTTDELQSIRNNAEDMLTRLEEFHNLLLMMKNTSCANIQVVHPQIMQMKEHVTSLSQRIDNLDILVSHLQDNLDALEEKVNEAKTKLNIPGSSIKSFLKPIFGNSVRSTINPTRTTNRAVNIIDVDKYFTLNAEEAVEATVK